MYGSQCVPTGTHLKSLTVQGVAKRLSIANLVVWLEPASSTFETIV